MQIEQQLRQRWQEKETRLQRLTAERKPQRGDPAVPHVRGPSEGGVTQKASAAWQGLTSRVPCLPHRGKPRGHGSVPRVAAAAQGEEVLAVCRSAADQPDFRQAGGEASRNCRGHQCETSTQNVEGTCRFLRSAFPVTGAPRAVEEPQERPDLCKLHAERRHGFGERGALG